MYHTDIIYNPEDNIIDELRLALKSYDQAKIGVYESSSVIVCIRDADKKIIAGAHVYFEVGCLHLDVLWVHENERGTGLGSQLLKACEDVAIKHGVRSFSSLGFL
jgi:GNAT superfamily N-acetyltransferase